MTAENLNATNKRCLEIGPSAKGRKRRGWDTLDMQPGCTFRTRWGYERLPFPDNSYDHVLASHVLEHIPWFLTSSALSEIYRTLAPRGVFEVWVPDFRQIVNAYRTGIIISDGWYPLNPKRDPWKSLNGRVFWGARSGEIGQEQHFHRACFDKKSLTHLLRDAGFTSIHRLERRGGEGHGWIDLGLRAVK